MSSSPIISVAKMPPSERLQYNMIQVHNIFKCAYDIILENLDKLPTDSAQRKNFLGYCKAWAESIDGHHTSEEDVVFPFLNQKMDFSGEKEQHVGIHNSLEEILEQIKDAEADSSSFDAELMKSRMVALKKPFFQHLDEEVEHIAPDNVKVFEDKELLKMDADLEKYARSHGDPHLVLPFMMSHIPPELKPTWPPMPWLVRKVVVPFVFARKYSGYWKYSPYSVS